MAEDNPLADPEDDADLLRPSWHDTPDETDADRRVTWRPRPTIGQAPSRGPDTWLSDAALAPTEARRPDRGRANRSWRGG